MVRYYNDEGVFDGSVEKVWKLIMAHSDDNLHNIHPAFVSAKTTPGADGSLTSEVMIRGPDGKAAPARMRFTPRPPHANTVEFLTGPFAGSWSTNTYVAEGPGKTRVIATGDFRVAGVTDEATVRKIVDDFMNHGFEEDNAYLKKMA